MFPQRLIRGSKFLSKHLRHAPGAIGLELQPGGWIEVDDLLQACAKAGVAMSRDELEAVVSSNDKQRFGFDETGARIRAHQGHSVPVDLQLAPQVPPPVLYHGTARQFVAPILRDGLHTMQRRQVHLSPDVETARRVSSRHGAPVVLEVDAHAMHEAGLAFFCSDNGVWLVDEVPPQFLRAHQVEAGR